MRHENIERKTTNYRGDGWDMKRLLPKAAALLFAAGMAVWSTSGKIEGAVRPSISQSQPATSVDWKPVEQAMGLSGKMQPDGVLKFSLPRSDLEVTVKGVKVKPALALGSWVAFKKMGKVTMAMGDLVLTEEEVSPVILKLQEGGIEQTGMHNHLLYESPRVIYLHITGQGDPVKMAQAVHTALALTKTPLTAPAEGSQSQGLELDIKQLDQILGRKGKVSDGVYQFSVPRAERIMEGRMEVPASMGVATVINFQPTGGGKAAITGDFVLVAGEVNPVLRTLRENGIEVTALHSHMLTERPHLFFMHYWANDEAVKLARGLRAALDQTHSAKGPAR